VLIVCTECWARAALQSNDLGLNYWVSLPLIAALGVAALSARWGRLAFVGLAIAQAVRIWNEFPAAGNHSYLELLLCLLSASLNVRGMYAIRRSASSSCKPCAGCGGEFL
jgi:hypothetical protein